MRWTILVVLVSLFGKGAAVTRQEVVSLDKKIPDRSDGALRRATLAGQVGNPSMRRSLITETESTKQTIAPVVQQKKPTRSDAAVRRATRAAASGNPAMRRSLKKSGH